MIGPPQGICALSTAAPSQTGNRTRMLPVDSQMNATHNLLSAGAYIAVYTFSCFLLTSSGEFRCIMPQESNPNSCRDRCIPFGGYVPRYHTLYRCGVNSPGSGGNVAAFLEGWAQLLACQAVSLHHSKSCVDSLSDSG